MPKQRKIFVESEADSWFERNRSHYESAHPHSSPLADSLRALGVHPKRALEIGSSSGFRLNQLHEAFGCESYGIDPSASAVADGTARYPALDLRVGTAESLPFEDEAFDLIVFGFCLYLCDRQDLFKIASEADRCLQNHGTLVVTDFCPPFPYRNRYAHHPGLHSYKMDYSKMFLWNPAYTEVARNVCSHTDPASLGAPDDRVATIILRKDQDCAYADEPFAAE